MKPKTSAIIAIIIMVGVIIAWIFAIIMKNWSIALYGLLAGAIILFALSVFSDPNNFLRNGKRERNKEK